jgi:hypothetical protein
VRGIGLAPDDVLRHRGMAMEHRCEAYRELKVEGSTRERECHIFQIMTFAMWPVGYGSIVQRDYFTHPMNNGCGIDLPRAAKIEVGIMPSTWGWSRWTSCGKELSSMRPERFA